MVAVATAYVEPDRSARRTVQDHIDDAAELDSAHANTPVEQAHLIHSPAHSALNAFRRNSST